MINCKRLTIMLLLLLSVLVCDTLFASGELRCIQKEREALLKFKEALIDDGETLSSWGSEEHKKECCLWKGIKCSNETGNVIALQLRCERGSTPLRGKFSKALIGLNYLSHLDLSFNDFGYQEIPEFIGSLKKLQHLNFGFSNISGVVPHQLGTLTNLKILDLEYNDLAFEKSAHSRHTNVLHDIFRLPSLTELYLSGCHLPTIFFVNSSSTSLSVLDLSDSGLTSSSFHWLFNISTNLRRMDLSKNDIHANIPDEFGRCSFLEYLDLHVNQLIGGVPKSLGNLTHLQTLNLSWNHLSEPLAELFYKLSMGANESLEILKLDENNLYGSLPDLTLFPSLRILQLQSNQLNGSFPHSFRQHSRLEYLDLSLNQITSVPDLRPLSVSLKELHLSGNKLKVLPTSLWQLSNLEILDVSFNSFEGTISDFDLSKYRRLKVLDFSFNSLFLNFTADWIPPFQLHAIRLASCNMGTHFPTWIQTQINLSELDLSLAGISEEVPKWLWDLSPRLTYLNLSHNQIVGIIPEFSSEILATIDFSSNNFSGHMPLFPPNSWILLLSNNMFTGPISPICTIPYSSLSFLDLSNNQFSGELPNCWEKMNRLEILNLAKNSFSGTIPHTLGSLHILSTLHLHDNNFSGELPSTLRNCQDLFMIDVGGNGLTGNIPTWIGTQLTSLTVLSLRHNNFHGSIPPEICYLTRLLVLDLSRNSISGRIPHCFNNLTSLVEKNRTIGIYSYDFRFFDSSEVANFDEHTSVQWKGALSEYRKILRLLKLVDLSSNRLVGNVPGEFSHLRAIISLNLSRNYLSGNIISNIGEMEMLECLDLSRNLFSGEIPIGLAELHYLSVLDLSNNNLSGKIPLGTQLQLFDPSVYAENSELCGLPLTSCPGDGPDSSITDNRKQEINTGDEEDEDFIAQFLSHEFYISIILGFIVGFWGVVGTLVVKSSWRNAYFNLFYKIRDWFYVRTTIYIARLRQSLRANVNVSNSSI